MSVIEKLEQNKFHKLIIGAALKDYQCIEDFAYLFTHAQADVIDISAFPHSVISAKKGLSKAIAEKASLTEPLIMISVNIGEDPHFRRVELNTDSCTECLACIPSCPSEAFTNTDNFQYNIDLCFGCSNCLDYCDFDALKFTNWQAFENASLNELQKLGANAIEIHLNNDLEAFADFYINMQTQFKLESFCIGSAQMNERELLDACEKIIHAVENKHGKEQKFIIQTDGNPISGAIKENNDQDQASINNAKLVIDYIKKKYPEKENLIFLQLAGGTNEKTLAKAHKQQVPVNGVAIGSYARKKINQTNPDERIITAKKLVSILN